MPLWLEILLVIAVFYLFTWYLSPYRKEQSGKIQIFVAKTWIIFRRLVSFSAALLGLFTIYIVWDSDKIIETKIYSSIAISFVSVFFVYVGIVGQGWVQYGFRDDISLYKKIKEIYKIRW